MQVELEVKAIAVSLNKSEQMRVSAGQRFAALWAYVTTPGTDGAQQVINMGYEPTQEGVWNMIVDHPAYPQKIGTSFRFGKRLLAIGRAPDAERAEAEDRANHRAETARSRAKAEAEVVTKEAHMSPECNSAPSSAPLLSLNALTEAVQALSLADFEAFKVWFRGYCKQSATPSCGA